MDKTDARQEFRERLVVSIDPHLGEMTNQLFFGWHHIRGCIPSSDLPEDLHYELTKLFLRYRIERAVLQKWYDVLHINTRDREDDRYYSEFTPSWAGEVMLNFCASYDFCEHFLN